MDVLDRSTSMVLGLRTVDRSFLARLSVFIIFSLLFPPTIKNVEQLIWQTPRLSATRASTCPRPLTGRHHRQASETTPRVYIVTQEARPSFLQLVSYVYRNIGESRAAPNVPGAFVIRSSCVANVGSVADNGGPGRPFELTRSRLREQHRRIPGS